MIRPILLIPVILLSSNISLCDEYYYFDVKMGGFFEPCLKCNSPDGRLPTFISLGYHYDINYNFSLEVEALHRSNFDKGFPVTYFGDDEYSRDGVFIKLRYKF